MWPALLCTATQTFSVPAVKSTPAAVLLLLLLLNPSKDKVTSAAMEVWERLG